MRSRAFSLAAGLALTTAVLSGCGGSQAPAPAAQGSQETTATSGSTAPRPGEVVNLKPQEVQQRLESGENLLVLDVREDWEFAEGHIPGAKLIPLGTLPDRLDELDPEAPVVVVCRSGNRSARGAAILAEAGFAAVYNMTGGMNQWPGEVEK